MKVFIITKEGFPNGMAASKRILNYAHCLISQNIACEIVVYTRTEIYGKIPRNTIGHGQFRGVWFRYIKGTPLRESNALVRYINDILDRFRLLKFLRHTMRKGDVVIGYNGTDLFSRNIVNVVHKCGARYFQEICELPFATSIPTSSMIRKRLKFEDKVLPRVDGVITISDSLTDYVKSHCAPTSKIIKIPILVDSYFFAPCNMCCPVIDVPYIFHCGTLYEQKDGFLSLLKTFACISKKLTFPVKLICTGAPQGTMHDLEISAIINRYNLQESVLFVGYISDKEIKEYLNGAAFVVINKLDNEQNRYCFSTKLGEYMAAGKAIITTRIGEAQNWLTDMEDSLLVDSGNTDQLASAMVSLFSNKTLCNKLGNNARITCENSFSIAANAPKLVKSLMQ